MQIQHHVLPLHLLKHGIVHLVALDAALAARRDAARVALDARDACLLRLDDDCGRECGRQEQSAAIVRCAVQGAQVCQIRYRLSRERERGREVRHHVC